MDKKKILIVSRSFYPQNSPRSHRTTELAKELSRQGHELTVLTPKEPDVHKPFEREHQITIKDLGKPRWKNPNFGSSKIGSILTRLSVRLLQLAIEYPSIELMYMVKKALRKERDYDLLISIAAPHPIHWGVAKAWRKDQTIAKTWVADCGDPFMGQENDSFKHPFYFKYVEKWFSKKADYLSVPVETAIPAYYPEFHHKIKVIPQGFNFDEVKTVVPHARDYPHFAYAGGLIQGRRDPKEFLEYLVSIKEEYRFDIYTNQKELVQDYADRSNGRIVLKDYLPRLQLLTELSKLDFVVNFENVGQKQMPSKLIDYAIIKKPILSISSFTFRKDPVIEFLQGNYANAYKMENPEQYKIEYIANQFISLTSIK